MIRTLTTTRGEQIVTDLTDQQAIDTLIGVEGTPRLGEYGHSLVAYFRRNSRLTERQIPYCHKIALRLLGRVVVAPGTPAPAPAPTPTAPQAAAVLTPEAPIPLPEPANAVDLSALVRMFGNVNGRLQQPQIRVRGLRFAPRAAGGLRVTSNGGAWLGNTDAAGMLSLELVRSEEHRNALRAIAANAVQVTAEEGRRTGRCCYCRRPLTDHRSTDVGYGPVCASTFGLPWGGTSQRARPSAAARTNMAHAEAQIAARQAERQPVFAVNTTWDDGGW